MDSEVQRFKSWLIENSLPTGSIALWFVLHHTQKHSEEWFEAKNSMLQSLTGMSEKGLQKARKRLVDERLIEYREQPRKAGEYMLLSLVESQKSTADSAVDSAANSTAKSTINSAVNSTIKSAANSTTSEKGLEKAEYKLIEVMEGQVELPKNDNLFGNAAKQFGILTKKTKD